MSILETVVLLVTPVSFIAGGLAIWYQVRETRALKKGSFLLELDSTFDVHHNQLLEKLMKDTKAKSNGQLSESSYISKEDLIHFVAYLTFFEILFQLLDKKLLIFKDVDDLFGYRFFIAIENDIIQDEDLCKDRQDYRNIFRLHKLWSDFRKSNQREGLTGVRGLSDWPHYDKDGGLSYEELTSW